MVPVLKKRKKFGEIAVAKGLITKWQLEQALAEQEEVNFKGLVQKRIGAILMEKGFIEIDDIKKILDEQEKGTFWSWVNVFFMLKRGV